MLENFTQLTADTQHLTETFGDITMQAIKVTTKSRAKKTGIEKTLAERGANYGDFPTHARITQEIKRVMYSSPKWQCLSDDKREALEMVAHKIGRILNGDPKYKDSWVDIEGYVHLISQTLED